MVNYIYATAVWLTAATAVTAVVLPQVPLATLKSDSPSTKLAISRTARFDHHKLVHITPPCPQTHSNAVYESAVLQKLSTEKTALYKALAVDKRLDVWSVDHAGSVVVRVDPQQLQDLRDWVSAVGDWYPCTDEETSSLSEPFKILVDDIQPALDAEAERLSQFSQLNIEVHFK